jgi:hypothetical protein
VNTVRDEAGQTLRQVIRGERNWADLAAAGIKVQLGAEPWTVENPGHVSTRADAHDIAKGFLAHMHDPRSLKEWAFVVEAVDAELDVESHPAGEMLMNALWDASFGKQIPDDVVHAIEQLAAADGSKA